MATDPAERFREVSAAFTRRVDGVSAGRWDDPAPCEGWVARDVVRHMVEWMPAFLEAAGGPPLAVTADVDVDPAGAWVALRDGLQGMLDDPAVASSELAHPYAGTHRFDAGIDTFFTNDVFMHTWDLARATGQPEQLDEAMAAEMLAGMEPIDGVLRQSGHYGPKVEPPPGADATTRLMAFVGRPV
ncbi:MAG: TIGR03086 family metal-binding protein [Acidimicrobiales bacterium]